MLFDYRGRNSRGELVNGQLEGASADAVATQLFNIGVTPVSIVAAKIENDFFKRLQDRLGAARVRPETLIMLTRQLYTVTKAGIPLMRGIRSLSASIQHPGLQRALSDIGDSLETGMELSSALHRHEDIFSPLYINLVRVGENSGRLEEAFLQLSQYLERDFDTARRLRSALRYPSFVIVAMVLAMVVINLLVIPEFAKLFESLNMDLPLPTMLLIGMSNLFVKGWPWLLGTVLLTAYGVRGWLATPAGQYRWGRMKLRLPIVGSIIERGSMGRYARSFALMLKSGVPLPHALTLCSRAIDNSYLGEKIMGIREGVEKGESLLQTHNASQMFTPLVLQMIAVGEEAGEVDELLREAAEFYEREVEYDLKSLSDKIEPLIIIVLAAFVLLLALGIFLPMWEFYASVQPA